jgi:hypothetical protein
LPPPTLAVAVTAHVFRSLGYEADSWAFSAESVVVVRPPPLSIVVPDGQEAEALSVWVPLALVLVDDWTIEVPDRPPAMP